jgi:two-component system response regulator AtoC
MLNGERDMKEAILLIEDEKLIRISLVDSLLSAGYEVAAFDNGAAALEAFREGLYRVVVTDVKLPDIDGLTILRELMKLDGGSQVIVMTAFGTIHDAVEVMKLGAFHYITKPFSLDEFLLLIERALDVRKLKDENLRLRKDISNCFCFPNIIGESEAMKKIFSVVERVSLTDSNVLLLGESGTGKELIATTVHYQSKRRDKPLIKVNCGALPEGLTESELFGHERGAFTGAIRRRPGRFELADKGTIFLDEIGDLPPSTQAKLLRVLQERKFERVGGTETFGVDVRVIAATNKNLIEEVKRGTFREDLYYRLNVIPIVLPPLRDRKEDIPALTDFFLEKCARQVSRKVGLSKEAREALLSYRYPGNVRELQNIVERCVTLSASDLIGMGDLPSGLLKNAKGYRQPLLSDISVEAEREYIIRTLKATKRNRTRAAEILGISRKTLWEKMNAYGITCDRPPGGGGLDN